jgi:hypothetical protein
MPYGQTQIYELFKRFKNGRILVDDDEHSARPSTGTRPKMWQKFVFNSSFIRTFFHQDRRWKENSIANFWGEWDQNIRRKPPDKWRNNCWALNLENAPAHASLLVQQFLASTNKTVIPHLPTHRTSPPAIFFAILEDEIEAQGETFWQH